MEKIQGKDSEFNWAALFIKSLDEQVNILSRTNLSPTFFDNESGKHYYEIGIETLTNLFIKLSGHLTVGEKDEGKKLRKILLSIQRLFPIFQTRSNVSFGGNTQHKIINQKNLKMMVEVMFEFQLKIFHWIEAHKLGTPTAKDIRKAAIDL